MLLAALSVETIGQLPDYYFQAIGSGAGAIAAWEAATRLVEDGRFGCTVPSLMLSQTYRLRRSMIHGNAVGVS